MKNYYLFGLKDAPIMASAYAPEETELAHELIQILDGVDELPFEFELFRLSTGKKGLIKDANLIDLKYLWLDYQPNSLAWPLFSEKLKNIFLRNMTGNENINWITAKINNNKEQRIYFIPRFEKQLDVIDENKTMYLNESKRIIVPHFSCKKISQFSVFHIPETHNLWKITSGLYVNEAIKKEIQTEKIGGVNFEKVNVS